MKLSKGTISIKDKDGNWKPVGEVSSFEINPIRQAVFTIIDDIVQTIGPEQYKTDEGITVTLEPTEYKRHDDK